MAAVILAWDPDEPQWAGIYAADTEIVRSTGVVRRGWSLAADPGVEPGMDVWLLVVGRRHPMRGLVGHGVLAGIDVQARDGETPTRLDIDVDLLLPHGDQIPTSQLPEVVQGIGSTGLPALVVHGGVERALRALWAETVPPQAGTVDPVPGALPAAAVTRTPRNLFEQDPALRRVALAHRGSACHACGLDFEQLYGQSGTDLMQVHLITPLALIHPDYEPDALVDLVPLCPSCHVVAHSRWPEPYRVEEIRSMLRRSGFLRGTVLSDEQLEAEAAAARILGARLP